MVARIATANIKEKLQDWNRNTNGFQLTDATQVLIAVKVINYQLVFVH